MPHMEVSRRLCLPGLPVWLLACLACAPSLLVACSEGGPVVQVSVSGLTDEVRSLEVRGTLSGQPSQTPQQIKNNLAEFVVPLPSGSRGTFILQVDGLQADGCLVA